MNMRTHLTIPCEPCVFFCLLGPVVQCHVSWRFCYPFRTSQWFAGCEGCNFNPPSTKSSRPWPGSSLSSKNHRVEKLWNYYDMFLSMCDPKLPTLHSWNIQTFWGNFPLNSPLVTKSHVGWSPAHLQKRRWHQQRCWGLPGYWPP